MIPENKLSTEYVEGLILAPDDEPYRPLHSYEKGGIGLQDPSQGLMVQDWHCFYHEPSFTVFVEAPNTPQTQLFVEEGITHLSFCFDQNMRWACAYTLTSGTCKMRWYDSQVAGYVTTTLVAGTEYPFLCMDDKRTTQLQSSDIILTYLRPSRLRPGTKTLFFLAQRERFTVEHFLADGLGGNIYNLGMTNKWRLQWDIFDFEHASRIVLDNGGI